MKRLPTEKPMIGKMPSRKRLSIRAAPDSWAQSRPYFEDQSLPLLIEPRIAGIDVLAWLDSNRDFIQEKLLKHGALLFRNFQIESVPAFEDFIKVASGGALKYKYRASPRHSVGKNIYTSTDYPDDQAIFPHNEHSYSPVFPRQLFFFCLVEPGSGGQTPIGDCRTIFERIPETIAEHFREKGILYVRNYNDGFGLPWQVVFQTEEKGDVESFCRQHGIEMEWKGEDRLRTRQVGPAIVRHPQTGERVWFNHATFFHVSTLPDELRQGVLNTFAREDLPTNTYYGDGSEIEAQVLETLRQTYRQAMVEFPWQQGDVLMIDNMLTVHGRNPFTPPRKIVVGMAKATTWENIQLA